MRHGAVSVEIISKNACFRFIEKNSMLQY